jgi:hypothetical protein
MIGRLSSSNAADRGCIRASALNRQAGRFFGHMKTEKQKTILEGPTCQLSAGLLVKLQTTVGPETL